MPSAANTEIGIIISAEGGADAAEQLHGIGDAVETISAADNRLAEIAGRGGVHIMGLEMLRASGMAGESRPIIMLLYASLQSLGPAGIAAALGLGALGAAAYKLYESLHPSVTVLENLTKAQEASLSQTSSLKSSLDSYSTSVKSMTPELANLKSATDALAASEASQEIHLKKDLLAGYQGELAKTKQALVDTNDAMKQYPEFASDYEKHTQQLTSRMLDLQEKTAQTSADIKALESGYASAAVQAGVLTTVANTQSEALKKLNDLAVSNAGKWAAIQESQREEQSAAMDAMQTRAESFFGIQRSSFGILGDSASKTFQAFSTGFGQAIGKMIVEGKDFYTEMHALFKKMAEDFITYVTEMMMKWLAFKALTSIGMFGMGGGGAVTSTPAAGVGVLAAGGYEGMVSQPTLFMAGEAGPERVSIAPMSGGGSGPAGGVSIGAINVSVNVSGVNDPQMIAQQVAPYIIQEIRGRAQVSFTGPSIV